MTFSTDAKIAVSRAVRAVTNALEASASSSTVQRFVYTSSSFAVTFPQPGEQFTVTPSTFNDEALMQAFEPGASGGTIYAASKLEAERAIREWLVANEDTAMVVKIGEYGANVLH
jgi:nucleoside-diphosphate-sugar epimerase